MPASILVTGSVRSGTTWVGRMLCLSKEMGYIHEPFNPARWPGWASERFPHELVYVNAENEATYFPVMQDVLNMRFPLMHHIREILAIHATSGDWPGIGSGAFAIPCASASHC